MSSVVFDHFSIEPDFILVIAVAHVKRKPGYWNDRIEKYG